jgi:TIR domain
MIGLSENLLRYDVFLSYSHRDEKWVQKWLLPRLEAEGLRVCIDFRDFELGAPSLVEMERSVLQSQRTLLILTPEYLSSEWAEFENILAQTLDPAARQRRLIPLLLKPCELPLRIRSLTYLDLSKPESREFQLNRLLKHLKDKTQRIEDPPIRPVLQPRSQFPSLQLSATPQNRVWLREESFWTHGPLPFDHPSYQVRQTDDEIYKYVQMYIWDYYMEVLTSHQMGATSLLFRLMHIASSENLQFVYVDLSQLPRTSEDLWYEDFCRIVDKQVGWQADQERIASPIQFRQHLLDIANSKPYSRTVVVLGFVKE